jgi:endonuclease/exonuclease/phosphatase family metal-dependent hydrolase
MSWNIKHLGRTSLNYKSAVQVLKNGDVIALQEVNTKNGKEALEQLGLMFEKELGEKTCEGITEPTEGPGPERYAFIWINSKASLVKDNGEEIAECPEGALPISLNKTHEAKIDREPAQALFVVKGSKKKFSIASVHLVPTAKKPANEVPWLFESVKNSEGVMIVVGDFNLGSKNAAFEVARTLKFKPSFDNVPTSLKMNTRSLNEPYDNIWIRDANAEDAQVIDLYKLFPNIEQKKIYNEISDHSAVSATVAF